MSLKFTTHDLRTLRLLSRTSFAFSTPSSSKTLSFRFIFGGEPLNSITRRQIRQAIQNLFKKENSVIFSDTVIRYGAPEFKSRFFRHARVVPLAERIKGQTFFVDVLADFKIKPSSSEIQQLFNDTIKLFSTKTAFSLNQNKTDSGPSLRLAFVSVPSLDNSHKERSILVFRPSKRHLSINVQEAELSLVKTLSIVVSNPIAIVSAFPKTTLKGIVRSTTNPPLAILNLLAYRISQLQKS
jgi:hypothetical protein